MKRAIIFLAVVAAPLIGMLALQLGLLASVKQLGQMLLFAWPASILLIWMVLSVALRVPVDARADAAAWSPLSKAFHWLMALCMLGTATLMYYMVNIGDLEDPVLRAEYSALLRHHKSIGLLVLFLVFMRFAWNRYRARPPVPQGMTRLQAFTAKTSHHFLYLAMLLVPLWGWMASMTYGGRTFFFGLFEMPVWLPKNMEWAYFFHSAHLWGAWIMFGVVAIHGSAALWHHFARRDATLVQMLPTGAPQAVAADPIRSEPALRD